LKDPGVDGMIILNGFSGSGIPPMDWIDLAQDRVRWWALSNAVKSLRVP